MSISVAIFGLPAVGKSTVAAAVSRLISAEVRHCGDTVKSRATRLGLPISSLSPDEHRRIDDDTRSAVTSAKAPLVVEGRYLHHVLEGLPCVLLVELCCSGNTRAQRHCARAHASTTSLEEQDAESVLLAGKLYGTNHPIPQPTMCIATDEMTPVQVATVIASLYYAHAGTSRTEARSTVDRTDDRETEARDLESTRSRWDGRYQQHDTPWITGYPSTELIRVLDEMGAPAGPILEVGCGTGDNSLYLASRGLEVTGVDISGTAIAVARSESSRRGLDCRFIEADVLAIDADDHYDRYAFIFDRGFFHCLAEPDGRRWAFRAAQFLRPGGQMLLLSGSDRDTSTHGPPRLSSSYLLSTFLPVLAVLQLRLIRWDSLAASDWRPFAWSLVLQKIAALPAGRWGEMATDI